MSEIEIPKLPPNDEESRKAKPVAKARVIAKKEVNPFLESLRAVGTYILMDVLVPAAKETLTSMVSNGIEMLLYGEARGGRRHRSDRRGSYVSYSSIYDRDERDVDRPRRRKQKFDLDEIVLETLSDADEVLTSMMEILEEYGQVKVSDFYDLVGLPDDYTSERYGWTTLRMVEPRRLRNGGYVLDLPDPRPLDR